MHQNSNLTYGGSNPSRSTDYLTEGEKMEFKNACGDLPLSDVDKGKNCLTKEKRR